MAGRPVFCPPPPELHLTSGAASLRLTGGYALYEAPSRNREKPSI